MPRHFVRSPVTDSSVNWEGLRSVPGSSTPMRIDVNARGFVCAHSNYADIRRRIFF